MSSTNRGGQREISDYYRTPKDQIRAFIVNFTDDMIAAGDPLFKAGRKVLTLDPCAGGDATHEMAYPEVLAEWGDKFHVETQDIREDSRAMVKCDYLIRELGFKPEIIITNPPFSHALEIVKKALEDVAPGGFVIMLLRLNFLGSKARYSFLKNTTPAYIYVHSKRMSFTEGGGTDSIEYAHFVWKKGEKPEFSKLKVIQAE